MHSVLSVLAISFFNLSFVNSILLMMESRLKIKCGTFGLRDYHQLILWKRWTPEYPSRFFVFDSIYLEWCRIPSSCGPNFLKYRAREWLIFIAWFAYLIYFHIRFSFGALGKRLSYIAIACYYQIFAIFSMIGIHKF